MKNKTKKLFAIIVFCLLFIASLSLKTFATFITDINGNAIFGVIDGSLNTYNHELHYTNYDGTEYMLFCTQYGIKSPIGKEYTLENDFTIEYKANLPQYEKMAEMIYFGYAMNYGLGVPNTYEAQKAACCVQQYVWEYINNSVDGYLTVPSRDSWNSSYMSSAIYEEWLNNTQNLYNIYHSNVSFNNSTNKVNLGEETVLIDTNSVLQYYDSFNQVIEDVSFFHEKGENTLKIISSNSNNVFFNSNMFDLFKLLPNGNKYLKGTMSNYVYFNFNYETTQNLFFSNYINPSFFSVSVETLSGIISIKKTNSIGNSVADCSFGLYSDLKCTKIIKNGITDANGEIIFDNLQAGIYYIKEISSTNGYSLAQEARRVEVLPGQVTCIDLKNDEPTGVISIKKVDSQTNSAPQGDASFENAKYEVYAKEDIYNVAKTKKYYSKGDLVATRITDKKGLTEDIIDLPLGKYVVKEVASSNGYYIDTNEYDVELKYIDQDTKIIKQEVISKEKVKSMHVHIFKYGKKLNSNEKVGLDGAVFAIKLNKDVKEALEKGFTEEEIWSDNEEILKIVPNYAVITTDKTGNGYTKEKLPYGEYVLKEIKAPDGFLISNQTITFEINILEDYEKNYEYVKDIEVENERPTGELEIDKKIVQNENVDKSCADVSDLTQIEFSLTAKENIIDNCDNSVVYKKGEEIDKYILNEDGKLSIKDLPMGEYELQETKTLDGLVLNPKKYEVEFKQEDSTTVLYESKEEIKNYPTICEFLKTDFNTGEKLIGAKILLMDEDKNIIDTWISTEKPYRIEGLIVGKKYYLREEIAPKGYEVLEEVFFVVKNTSIVQLIEIKNKPIVLEKPKEDNPELPKQLPVTGDDINFAFALVYVEVLAVLMIIIIKHLIKDKKNY